MSQKHGVRRSGRVFHLGLMAALYIAITGTCQARATDDEKAIEAPSGSPLHLAWANDIALEEPSGVINVAISVTPASPDGFLVADMREMQVRRYGASGDLLKHFGRPGGGPGEFSAPVMASLQLHDGTLLVADASGHVTRLDATATTVLGRALSPVRPIYGILQGEDHSVYLTGRLVTARGTTLLHEWDYDAGLVRRSFFDEPQIGPTMARIADVAGGAMADVNGDTLAVLFNLSDTLYLVHRDGEVLRRLPLRMRHYQRRSSDPPPPGPVGPALQQWMTSFSRVHQPFFLSDGLIALSYYHLERFEPVWRTLVVDRQGSTYLDEKDTPQLLTVLGSDTLVFVKPGSPTPNVWTRATLER